MATLYLYTYNNYYNRRVKKEDTLNDYGVPLYSETASLNFNPNDGVNTTYIAGRAGNPYSGKADYAIYCEDNFNITSRWFIIEQTRTLKNQYRCTLRRDVVVDYYNDIINAPSFIEKATLPQDSPFIFNEEGITVNEIKKEQTLIKDSTDVGWIVGYYSKETTNDKLKGTIAKNDTVPGAIKITTPIEQWEYYQYQTAPYYGSLIDAEYWINYKKVPGNSYNKRYKSKYIDGYTFEQTGLVSIPDSSLKLFEYMSSEVKNAYQSKLSTLKTQIKAFAPYEENNNIANYDGKFILDSDNKLWSITVNRIADRENVTEITAGSMFNTLSEVVNDLPNNVLFNKIPNDKSFQLWTKNTSYSISITAVTDKGYKWDFNNYNGDTALPRMTTEDAQYNIFAIPYGSIRVDVTNPVISFNTFDKDQAMLVANSIMKTIGTDEEFYDLQLLPYCPDQSIIHGFNSIQLTNTSQYGLIQDTAAAITTNVGVIVHIKSASASSSFYKKNYVTSKVNNRKLSNEVEKFRLCSPNFSSYFDFKLPQVSTTNSVDRFYLTMRLKPYTPYIKIAPQFDVLYGNNYQDARGLILSGDFSLDQVNDAWKTYQLQNKNYQNIFDREIDNMQVTRKFQRIEQIAGATVGALSAGLNAGAITGNAGFGAGAGAASTIGGIVDYHISEAMYNEALDYKKDLFGYQLGNIRALPRTLTKVSAYNADNTIFPTIEYYSCSEEEKKAVANKVAYNGMSVGIIGKISDYIYNSWNYEDITDKGYIKAQVIRLENIADDTHLLNAIAEEIYKGVYFK